MLFVESQCRISSWAWALIGKSYIFTEFFEECIKEEEYEAQKYEILRDAVKAKVSYSTESRKMSETDTDDMPVSPKGDPPSDLPTVVEGVQNGKIAAS